MEKNEVTFELQRLHYEESINPNVKIGALLDVQLEILNCSLAPSEKYKELSSSLSSCEFTGKMIAEYSWPDFGETPVQQFIVDAGIPIRVTNYPKNIEKYSEGVSGEGALRGIMSVDYPRFLTQGVRGEIIKIRHCLGDEVKGLDEITEEWGEGKMFITIRVQDILPLKKSKNADGS